MQQKLNIISNCIIPHNIVLLGSLKERSMKNNDWKERLNIVYSTNPDYNYEMNDDEEQATLPPAQQRLRVQLDRKNRGGKVVTLVTGFVGTDNNLKNDRWGCRSVSYPPVRASHRKQLLSPNRNGSDPSRAARHLPSFRHRTERLCVYW